MTFFSRATALSLLAVSTVPTIASAQADGCWPSGTCEHSSSPVAASAQVAEPQPLSVAQPAKPGRIILYAHFGFGTPYGVLGLSLDVAATRWLVLEAGVGTNPDEGAEAAFTPRLRLEMFPDGYFTLGSGVSWAHRYVGHADPIGELVSENEVALPTWSPGYFWNTELGFEMSHGHFAFRIYPGYAKVINYSDYRCSEGQGCDPQGASSLLYFGCALGYAF